MRAVWINAIPVIRHGILWWLSSDEMWLSDRVSSTGWLVRVSDQHDSMSTRGKRIQVGARPAPKQFSASHVQCPTAFYCICMGTRTFACVCVCVRACLCRSLKSAARLPTLSSLPATSIDDCHDEVGILRGCFYNRNFQSTFLIISRNTLQNY